jgi:hypothetical protein
MYAVVEQDERTAYFYLYPAELQSKKYRMRACWLRNLQPGPSTRDSAAMVNGDAPMLEARFCNHPEGKAPLQAELIAIVWMPEEDGAAVLYDGETLGVIPGWSLYSEDPAAYAADCIDADANAIVFPLGDSGKNEQHDRVADAVLFRALWENTEAPQWPLIQEQFIAAYEKHFGTIQQYFAIDNNQWPPMALAKFEKDNVIYFLTMGVSIRPMPWVSYLYNENAPAYRRMELALAVSKDDYTEEEISKMAEALSVMADIPWRHISWLGEGHTIGSGKLPAPFESIVLSAALYNGNSIDMPEMYGDRVNLFWASPVTLSEREYAHQKANGGYELLEKMIEEDITHIVQKREAIV